jgi:lysophospholipase L1-like esterase
VKTILCYGDSNTWGYDPETGERFPPDVRWTGVLASELGDGYSVIEEGLNGRTTVRDDPIEEHKNGREYLRPCLASHQPLDLVVIALGVNDLKTRFSASASDVAEGASALVEIAQRSDAGPNGRTPEVLLVTPPAVGTLTELAEMFEDAWSKSRNFPTHYRRVAEKTGCAFLDASDIVVSSDLDGIHLERTEHAKLGAAIAAKVRDLLD